MRERLRGSRHGSGWTRLVAAAVGVCLAAAGCARHAVERPAGDGGGHNLLLVTLDTVRADRLGAYGYAAAETPVLDRLAREGVRFEQAIASAPLTLPSHATLLSGLLPPQHGLRNNGSGAFPAGHPTLAAELAAAGYRTAAFVGAFVLDRRFGLGRGFEIYDDEVPRPTGAETESERPAREVVDRALAWLDAADPQARPFFAWVHLYDAHAPYSPPEPYASRHPGRPYDAEIAAVDAEIGRLLELVERRGWSERTLVVVVGDHGEALGEHGELTHGLLLYEPTLRVPWLLRAPALLPAGWAIRRPVGLADLAPTAAALLGRAWPTAAAGRSLAADLRARREPAPADVYSETEYPRLFAWSALAALRRGDRKYIAAPRPELYELEADPDEGRDLAAGEPRAAAELARALRALRAPAAAVLAPPPDSETRARLASLGYVAGPAPAPTASPADPKDRVADFRRYEEAHWALAEGRVADAVGALEPLVAGDPANPVFRGALAEARRRTGEHARAAELYRQAAAAAPADPQVWYNLALTLQEGGRPEDAAAALAESVRLDPARPEAWNALGVCRALLGESAAAQAAFARAVELDPRNAVAANNLGNALRELGRLAEAEAAYRQAIAAAPEYPEPLNGLGTLEVQRDRPAAAVGWFERSLALAPARHEARLNLAIALELLGERDRALAAYRDFLAASADDPHYAEQRRAALGLAARLARPESTL
jgi:arylsulfatase A-like enzyme/Tfp pilus assembly protein PilF